MSQPSSTLFKRWLAVLSPVIGIVLGVRAESIEIDGLFYELDNANRTATLTYPNTESSNYTSLPYDVAIPSTFVFDNTSYTVTAIGRYAFSYCRSLSKVTIPNTVTSIGEYAFISCSGLDEITIPNFVTSIGGVAFASCNNLKTIYFNAEECSSIDFTWLSNTPVEKIVIGDTVKSIPKNAFYTCRSVIEVTIGKSVSTIEGSVFRGCENLKTIYFNAENLNMSSSGHWLYDAPVEKIVIGDNVKFISEYVFYNCRNLVEVIIPNSVTSIGKSAFESCTNLEEIAIPNSVISIGEMAFKGCNILTGVNIGNSVTNIGKSAFENCGSLFEVTLPNSVTTIGERAFYNCNSLKEIAIPPSVTSIEGASFSNCNNLHEVNIPNSVTSIGNFAFSYCSCLSKVTIPNSVIFIGQSAFGNCSSLSDVAIGSSVTTIGREAFASCTSLVELTIPDFVASIERRAFSNCSKLKTIYFNAYNCDPLPDDAHLFFGTPIEKVVIGDNVRSIPAYAFSYCDYLSELTIPNAVSTIGEMAFFDCSSLKEVTIPNSVLSIEEYAFASCISLAKVSIGDSVTFIGKACFENCSSLAGISIPNSVNFIGEGVFAKCSGLTYAIIPNSVAFINNYAFFECTSLVELTIPSSVSSIGEGTFAKCSSITHVNIPNSVISIDSFSFQHCSNLAEVTIPKSVTSIGCAAFSYCDNLKTLYFNAEDCGSVDVTWLSSTPVEKVEIGESVNSLPKFIFSGCSSLTEVIVSNAVTSIGEGAFSDCSNLNNIKIGNSVKAIGNFAFSGCTGLTSLYSLSILPPVCGNQALNDINKEVCTLFVPAGSSEEYKAAEQWKDFLYVNEYDAVLIESIHINVETLYGKTGETFQLVADIFPDNATRKRVEWYSSDLSIVTVDVNGLVTFVKGGYAIITARATDGSGIEASIDVVVTAKGTELGDSNANGIVNIADVVNTVNYTIGNDVEFFDETAADVNKDGVITLEDASATVTLILNQPILDASTNKALVHASAISDEADLLVISDYSAKLGETASVFVALDNTLNYVALQADVTVPESMTLTAVNISNRAEVNHSLRVMRIDDHTMRIALFNINNSTFADNNEAILELVVKENGSTTERIGINNILASDAQAHEYVLSSTGGYNTNMSGIDFAGRANICIETTADCINIINAEGNEVAIYDVSGTALAHFVASSDFETQKAAPGLYVVVAGNIVEKVMVK